MSRSDYDTELNILKTQMKKNYGNDAFDSYQGRNLEENLKSQVMNQLISEGLCLQEITRAHYSISASEIEEAYAQYIEDNSLNREGFEQYLESIAYPFDYF